MKTFKTPKGTELALMDLKGKPYLQVAYRLIWFREENPEASIKTEIIKHTEEYVLVRATIELNGKILAQAHKTEYKKDFFDNVEKAETGAIGRALAMCGFGTQFCLDEFDEQERIVDAPVEPIKRESLKNFAPVEDPIRQAPITKKAKELFKAEIKAIKNKEPEKSFQEAEPVEEEEDFAGWEDEPEQSNTLKFKSDFVLCPPGAKVGKKLLELGIGKKASEVLFDKNGKVHQKNKKFIDGYINYLLKSDMQTDAGLDLINKFQAFYNEAGLELAQ